MQEDEGKRDPAGHFARLSFDWGSGMPATDGDYVHGSVAIACADKGSYDKVFDPDFQDSVALLQEQNNLRRAGHYFHDKHDRTRGSYLVYGEITDAGHSTSFIGVEVHDYGAVSVYFREYTKAATIDELVGFWINGAWWIGLQVHDLLGTSGPAYATVLVDVAEVSDLSVPPSGGSLVKLTYGPFSLEDDLHHWHERAAKTLPSVRADILRESGGRRLPQNADEETAWDPWATRERLGPGRIHAKPRWWQLRWPRRRG
jgi:hypothetical protein